MKLNKDGPWNQLRSWTLKWTGAVGLVFLTSCGSSDGEEGKISVNLSNLNQVASVTNRPLTSVFNVAGDVSSSAEREIEELKYVIGQVQICESLTVSGSAFSGGQGCVTLYDWGEGELSAISASNFEEFEDFMVDLMSESSLSSFNASAKADLESGSYSYVTINWAPTIGVKGSVEVGGGTVVSTKSCTINESTGLCTASSAMDSGDAELAIVQSANGGTWFKFQEPLVISSEDVAAGTPYSIDLVFNPEGAIAASKSFTPSSTGYGQVSDSSGSAGHLIYVPMISLTPLPRPSEDDARVETYWITLPSGYGQTRVELISNASDSDHTIYGVNLLNILSTSDTGSPIHIDNGSKIATLTTGGDGTITLKDTSGAAIIEGLAREQDSSVSVKSLGGVSGTQTVASTYEGETTLN